MIAIDSPLDVGPSMQQLLEEKDTALNDTANKIENLDREITGLRAKVGWLESEVDFLTNDRYALVREKLTLQNKLGDFKSWPEFRMEYDNLTTDFVVMKSQRAKELILQEQTLEIAKETKAELAATKLAEAMSKTAHSKKFEQVQQERDEAKEKYQTLLATTTITPAATAATTVVKEESPRHIALQNGNIALQKENIALQKENDRLTFALRFQSSLLSKKSSDLDGMQSLLKTGSDHSALQLKTAASTIMSLQENKAKAEECIAELERLVQEANEKAEEMEERYMAVAFVGQVEGEKEVGQDEGSRGEKAETSWLLNQTVEMSKTGRKELGLTVAGSEADGSIGEGEEEEGGEEQEEVDDYNDDDNEEEDGGNKGEGEE